MYTFLLDRRSLTLFSGGLVAFGVLAFLAGMLVGLRINLPPTASQTAEFKPLSSFEGSLVATASAASLPASESKPAPAQNSEPKASASPASGSPSTGTWVETAGASSSVSRQAVAPAPERVAARVQAPALPEPGDAPKPSPAPEPDVEHRRSVSSGGFFVQIGAFAVEENARNQVASLSAEGFEPFIATLRTNSGRTLKAVRIGVFDTRADALAEAKRYVELARGREAIVRPVD